MTVHRQQQRASILRHNESIWALGMARQGGSLFFWLDKYCQIQDTQQEEQDGALTIKCLLMDDVPRSAQSGGFALIRCLVAKRQYLLTEKVQNLLSEGYFETEDLECSIVNGTVEKTECDEFKDSVGNKKYIIIGPDRCGYLFYSVGKLQRLDGSRIYTVITAHHAEENYD